MKQPVFISGTGMSGTSLMQAILNIHPECDILFEDFWKKENYTAWMNYLESHLVTRPGNKLPFGKMFDGGYTQDDLINICRSCKTIWMRRRYSGFKQSWIKRARQPLDKMENMFKMSQLLFDCIKDEMPDQVIMVQFEDLILRPESEIRRVCDFLGINFMQEMVTRGPENIPDRVKYYRQEQFDVKKVFVKRGDKDSLLKITYP